MTTATTLTRLIAAAAAASHGHHRQTPFSEPALALLDQLGLGRGEPVSTARARVLGFTSCLAGEGVTTIASETAAAAASNLGLRTVLVDCHFADPGVHRAFGVGLCPGLDDALEDSSELEPSLADLVRESGVDNLSLLTAGTFRKDRPAAWLPTKLNRVLAELREQFELVVCDLPAVSEGRPNSTGSLLDGVLLVVEAERVPREIALRSTKSLTSAGVNVLGAIVNKRRQHVPRWLHRTM